ncbi:MAG: thiol:disulfide interchange protein DsbG [Halomonas subglaciescola]|nr:thiol:disulfide interchange protein DsbG [Halomonas subglaciescola]
MKRLPRVLLTLSLAALATSAGADIPKADLPDPVAALASHGVEVIDTFEAPGNLKGYAATLQGKPVAVYLTEDGEQAILGTMVGAQGEDLSAEPLERIVSGPQSEKAWAQLETAAWVRDGSEDADTIIYEFTDPNCPYCHQFWQQARPWVDAGKVQIRHVLVGILKQDSAPKAATILAADDPAAAFARSEQDYDEDGIKVADSIPDSARKKVAENNALMKSLGYFATPTILYQKDNGDVSVKQGLPQGSEVNTILGGPKP